MKKSTLSKCVLGLIWAVTGYCYIDLIVKHPGAALFVVGLLAAVGAVYWAANNHNNDDKLFSKKK
jgi:hypothetical protein